MVRKVILIICYLINVKCFAQEKDSCTDFFNYFEQMRANNCIILWEEPPVLQCDYCIARLEKKIRNEKNILVNIIIDTTGHVFCVNTSSVADSLKIIIAKDVFDNFRFVPAVVGKRKVISQYYVVLNPLKRKK